MKHIFIIILSILLFTACKKNTSAATCNDAEPLYSAAAFPIGTAVNTDKLYSGGLYEQVATRQFNSITPENIFKPSYLHPAEHVFYWNDGDALVAYCTTNHKRLHGHTLIWHGQLPQWVYNFTGGPDDWERIFKDHIQTIVKHFEGSVTSWDVVNEAFNEDGTLRQTIWREHLGDTYIEKAFRYAHEADPNALLFYNEYSLEMNPTKRKSVLSLLNSMKARGVKIDGVGLQMHINISYPDISQIAEALKDISDNGYKVHLSELDISVNPFSRDISPTPDLLTQQASLLGALIVQYKALPAQHQYGITFWGFSDNDSWIPSYFSRKDYPCIYNADYLPKPAYCKLKESL